MRWPFIFTSLGVVRGESKRGNRKCGPENSRPRAIIDPLSSLIDFIKKGTDPQHKQLFLHMVCYNNDLTVHTAHSLIIHTTILWSWKTR